MRHFLVLAVAFSTTLAAAQPVAVEQPRPGEPTPTEPATVPVPLTPATAPDRASGVAVEDTPPAAQKLLWLPRAILFVPRWALWAVVQPVRGGTYVYQRYDLGRWLFDTTFTDDGQFGIYPIVTYDSVYLLGAGLRVLYKDIFGEGERLTMRGDFGGEFKFAVGGHLTSGERFGRVRVDLDSSIERRPRDPFYGIGNGDELPLPANTPPPELLDPTLESSVVSSRFRQDVLRTTLGFKIRVVDGIYNRVSGAWLKREFDGSKHEDILDRYDTSKLIGFDSGVDNVYAEDELTYDTRRPSSPWATQTIDATGWLVRGYAGVSSGIGDDPTSYYAYGGEVQRFFDLYEGTRVLGLRAMVDAIGGSDGRTDGNISFVDLPRLGGPEYLRGYPTGRFRDRIAVLGTAEYTWTIMNHAAAYLFFDIGKPIETWAQAGDGPLRFGYGFGLQIHTKHTFFMRGQLGISRDGNLELNLVLSPAFGRRVRAGRL